MANRENPDRISNRATLSDLGFRVGQKRKRQWSEVLPAEAGFLVKKLSKWVPASNTSENRRLLQSYVNGVVRQRPDWVYDNHWIYDKICSILHPGIPFAGQHGIRQYIVPRDVSSVGGPTLPKTIPVPDVARLKFISLLTVHWFCVEPEEYRCIVPLSLMSPQDLTAFDVICPIDTLLKTKFANAQCQDVIDSLRPYVYGTAPPTFRVDAETDEETDEETEIRIPVGSFNISNIEHCIKVNNAGYIAEKDFDRYCDVLKKIVSDFEMTLGQFRAACYIHPDYITSPHEPDVADRFLRNILAEPMLRAFCREALTMKFFKPDGRFGWQGLAKIITANNIGWRSYISTPFTELEIDDDLRAHVAAREAIESFAPLRNSDLVHKQQYMSCLVPILDVILNSIHLLDLTRNVPEYDRYAARDAEGAESNLYDNQARELQIHEDRIARVIRRLRDDYHVSSLYDVDETDWLQLDAVDQVNRLPHYNPIAAFETWNKSDFRGINSVRQPPEHPNQLVPIRRWHLIEEALGHLFDTPLVDSAKAKRHFARQTHPIYSRSTSTHLGSRHAASDAIQPGVEADACTETDTAEEKNNDLSLADTENDGDVAERDEEYYVGSLAVTRRDSSESDRVYSVVFPRVTMGCSLQDIIADFEFDINDDGRFPRVTEAFFMKYLSIMEKNREAWQSIDDSMHERCNDEHLDGLTDVHQYSRLCDVQDFCMKHYCAWYPERLDDLPKFIRFELRGNFYVQYELARRYGQPEPRGMENWMPLPFPRTWF